MTETKTTRSVRRGMVEVDKVWGAVSVQVPDMTI